MTYTKVHADWKDSPDTTTPITSAKLETIEQGIYDAHYSTVVAPTGTSAVAQTIQGLAAQTGDLTQWKNSGGTVLGKVNASARFTFEDGTNYPDSAIYNLGHHRLFSNLTAAGSGTAGSANQGTLVVETQIPVTSAAAHYEKAALFAIARTIDPSVVPTINRDCVGAHLQGFSDTTTTSRVWGAYVAGQIESGDGQAIGIEIDLINKAAADVSTMTGTKVKTGLALVASGTQNATAAIHVNQSGTSKWHKGLYADPNVLFADASTFLELDGRFVVNKAGAVITTRANAGDAAYSARVTGDTFYRIQFELSPTLLMGTGASAPVQVLTTRRTGWAAATGTPTRTTFVTSSVTLPQLAERVKALIDDLITHGMIGA